MAKINTMVKVSAEEAIAKDARHVVQTYGRQPIVLT
jgi:acetylornithine/N-succinyldiaminopimelate aminotransferase